MASRREFHLVQDFIPDGPASSNALTRSRKSTLVVPDGVSYLIIDAAGELRIATEPETEFAHRQIILEPIWNGQQLQLLLIGPSDEPVFVNGRVTSQLSVLVQADQFQADDDHLLHVLLFNRPDIGPPSPRSVGLDCPICRSKIDADMRVYTCPTCDTALHLQGEETPPETRLECAMAVFDCPVCRSKIDMTAGYAWEPELYCG